MSVAGDAWLDRKDARKKAANGKKTEFAEWRGFVNVDLNAGQKSQFEDWAKTGEAWEILDSALLAGCVVSVKRDSTSGGFLASVTQRDPLSINAGLCVTARAGESGKSLFRCMFLLAVVGVGEDWTAGRPMADPERW